MNFQERYRRECILAGTSPLHVVEAYLTSSTLNFNFFRIPSETEWAPIFEALSHDSSLKKIVVTIDYDNHTVKNPTHQQKLKQLRRLVEHLCHHLGQNTKLTELQLIGLPLADADVKLLSKGLKTSKSLQHLSLSQCNIGDHGLTYIADAVQGKPSIAQTAFNIGFSLLLAIVFLDLSSSCLTRNCRETLNQIVHHQIVNREKAFWQASLRNETPDKDLMGGLRRLALNDNNLGDALTVLFKTLHDDKWIKALDLQYCQLTDEHLVKLISAATKNKALVFADVRNNPDLSPELVEQLGDVLRKNSLGSSLYHFNPIEVVLKHATHAVQFGQVTKKQKPSSAKIAAPMSDPTKKKVKRTASAVAVRSSPVKTPTRPPVAQRSPGKPKRNEQPAPVCKPEQTESEELMKERHARLDAERQVIKMYGELETAWAKIAKLEIKIKQLKKRDRSIPWPISSASPMAYQDTLQQHGGILVDPPTLQSFQQCLGQLQNMLSDLKATHSAALTQPVETRGNEVEAILGTLHSAVRDLVSKVNNYRPSEIQYVQPSTNSYNIRPTQLYSDEQLSSANRREIAENFVRVEPPTTSARSFSPGVMPIKGLSRTTSVLTQEDSGAKAFELSSPKVGPDFVVKPASVPRTLTSTPLSEAPAPKLEQLLLKSKTIDTPKFSAETSAAGSATGAKAPPSDANVAVETPPNGSKSNEHSQSSESRAKSLKNLKNNLEQIEKQLLLQLRPSAGDQPTLQAPNIDSILSSRSSVNESSASHSTQRNSNYTMEFDSSSTSVASTAYKPKKENSSKSEKNEKPKGKLKVEHWRKNKENGFKEDSKAASRSSSSVNLSSIVDLLGDFSLGDIGSSTITPP